MRAATSGLANRSSIPVWLAVKYDRHNTRPVRAGDGIERVSTSPDSHDTFGAQSDPEPHSCTSVCA